jgi:hypothetical protein
MGIFSSKNSTKTDFCRDDLLNMMLYNISTEILPKSNIYKYRYFPKTRLK